MKNQRGLGVLDVDELKERFNVKDPHTLLFMTVSMILNNTRALRGGPLRRAAASLVGCMRCQVL